MRRSVLSVTVSLLLVAGIAHAQEPQGSVTLGMTGWPTFHHDIRHTGKVEGTARVIYVGSEDFNVYAVNADGTLRWKLPTGGMVFSSPAIGPDGTVYVGSCDSCLYAISDSGALDCPQ